MLPEQKQKKPRSRQSPSTSAPSLAPLPPRTAVPNRHSVWIGALCQRCGKPLHATARLDPRAGDAQVIGQEVWLHVVTGEPGCPPH